MLKYYRKNDFIKKSVAGNLALFVSVSTHDVETVK